MYNILMKQMKHYAYHCGLTVRGYPSNRQRHIIFLNGRAQDFVYNRCVAINNELFMLRKVKVYCEPVAKRIEYLESIRDDFKQIANMAPFLNDDVIDSMAGANAIANYHNAWKQYKKIPSSGIPTFHKRTETYSYQTNPHYSFDKKTDKYKIAGAYFEDDTHIVLPKVGRIRIKGDKNYIRKMRDHTERYGAFTVTLNSDDSCYISVQLASDTPFKGTYEPTGTAVGIDVNVKNLYADSDGHIVDNPKYLAKSQKKLAKEQRKLSNKLEAAKRDCPKDMKLRGFLRTRKGYQKQRKKVAHIQSHVANQRKDKLHCKAKRLVKNHDIVVSEDLEVKNLLKNHRLAKAITDVSWGTFFLYIDIEAQQRGRKYIKVPPQYTTQTCSACGCAMGGDNKLDLSVREWTCPHCGTHHNRDINSAINIRNRGLAILGES